MTKNKLPLYYFKPSLCWVDDDQIFLDAVNLSFKEQYHCFSFSNPVTCLNHFETYQAPSSTIPLKREFTESDLFGIKNHYPIDIRIESMAEIAGLANKKDEVAVLIVDFHMPNLNGIELFEKLKHLPCKKILLTGQASHEKAVEAFNKGFIDRFIRKDHLVADELHRCIEELGQAYFYEQTQYLRLSMEETKLSYLTDPIFIDFFRNWRDENEIEEYYLVSWQGEFLTKNKNGHSQYFVCFDEKTRKDFVEINGDLTGIAASLVNEVKEGIKIPFFGLGKESWQLDFSDWEKHFYKSNVIAGNENYHWISVKDE